MKERQQPPPHEVAKGQRRYYPHELIGQPLVSKPKDKHWQEKHDRSKQSQRQRNRNG